MARGKGLQSPDPNGGLFKSTDGGNTWKRLPKSLSSTAQGLGRIGFNMAPSDNSRLYATIAAPNKLGRHLPECDEAGESWYQLSSDETYYGRASDFAALAENGGYLA